jgi:hypothetical protein
VLEFFEGVVEAWKVAVAEPARLDLTGQVGECAVPGPAGRRVRSRGSTDDDYVLLDLDDAVDDLDAGQSGASSSALFPGPVAAGG